MTPNFLPLMPKKLPPLFVDKKGSLRSARWSNFREIQVVKPCEIQVVKLREIGVVKLREIQVVKLREILHQI